MAEKGSNLPVRRKMSPGESAKSTVNVKPKHPTPVALPLAVGSNSSQLKDEIKAPPDKADDVPSTVNGCKQTQGQTVKSKNGQKFTGKIKSNSKDDARNLDNSTVSFYSSEGSQTWLYFAMLIIMTSLSIATRFYKIEVPAWVCWDETHFGKMGSWYINQTFFFDVHPPLGKMLIGLSGYLTGYDGMFAFDKPGDEYEDTPYVGMRMFCAAMGAALVPLIYMSTWLLCRSVTGAMFAATFVLCDSGVNTLSRYILLDPILMFFIIAATYCVLKFLSLSHRPFSFSWWFWLCATGTFLACSIGVKFVGLFVILLAGFSTVADLWRLMGQHSLSMVDVLKHFLARAVCLILIPAVCYMIFYAIHFKVLTRSGSGDGFYSSQFQSQLEGNQLHNISMPKYIAYGSIFSLKQRRTGGGYLHSHWHLYPEEVGPRQQQVTSYSHKDENNMWRLKPAHEEPEIDTHPILVKNGDLVRLEHIITRRLLHSHKEPAPLTHRHFQVSGYGQDGRGDANDIWQIDIPDAEQGASVLVVKSKLRLIHYHVRCALQSHDKKLPKWGWEQLEATCNPNIRDPKTLWSVEEVKDPRLPNVSFAIHSPSFLEMFIESHSVMTQGNAGLKPRDGEMTSRPWQWPITVRGQIFSGKDHRVYLLGNPIVFFIVLFLMAAFLCIYAFYSLRHQRGVKISKAMKDYSESTYSACWFLMMGWGLHYLPFWPMTRILYFHHYFPAFLYSAMLAGIILDYMIKMVCNMLPNSVRTTMFHVCCGVFLSIISYSFYLFHPLTYGMSGLLAHEEGSLMYGLKWFDSWEI